MGYEAVDGRRTLQDGLNVGRNRKPPSELIPELLNSEIKASLESADVILRPRLVDAPPNQFHIETVAEPARTSFKLLQHVADVTGVITVRLRLGLYIQAYDDGKQYQDKNISDAFSNRHFSSFGFGGLFPRFLRHVAIEELHRRIPS